jgi:hypothetical protein
LERILMICPSMRFVSKSKRTLKRSCSKNKFIFEILKPFQW